jgi:hypothetical protein
VLAGRMAGELEAKPVCYGMRVADIGSGRSIA